MTYKTTCLGCLQSVGLRWVGHSPILQSRRAARTACQAEPPSKPSPLDSSLALAAVRAAEARQAEPIVADPYADALASNSSHDASDQAVADLDALVARFLDEQLLKATLLVNMERKQEYNQVVVVGDAMDTRPFRLPWPTGTIIYLVGAAEVQQLAEAALKQQGARVPRGCLLRRVSMTPGHNFAAALERAGYRGDRLSVWAVQGANRFGLSQADLHTMLEDVANLAAFDSLVLGELPPMQQGDVESLMAAYGLLGTPVSMEGQPGWGRLAAAWSQHPEGHPRPWLFVAHQKRLSLQQMGIYSEHATAAEEIDEDFFGNFS